MKMLLQKNISSQNKKGWVANNEYCSKGNNILLHSDNYIDGKLIKLIKTLNDNQLS